MGFKKKVLGTLAAAALTLSMFGGVAAQQTANTQAFAKAEGGHCSITVTQANINFGRFKWNGYHYVNQQDSGTSEHQPLHWQVKSGNPSGCTGSISFSGLHASHGNTPITLSSFVGSITLLEYGTQSGPLAGSFIDAGSPQLFPGISTQTVVGSVGLPGIPDNTQPGDYWGTIRATVTNTQ